MLVCVSGLCICMCVCVCVRRRISLYMTCVSAYVCVRACACTEGQSGGGQGLDQVEFVSLLAGEDGSLFVVFHKLLHGVELALSDAVKVLLQLHLEMLVLALGLQGDGEVVRLWKHKER